MDRIYRMYRILEPDLSRHRCPAVSLSFLIF